MVMRTAINVRSGVALLLALACVALAQGPTRIVVLPFSESAILPGLGLGLATGLQRSLNTIDGLYVPAVGDAALFVRRALDAGLDPVASTARTFEAEALISGRVEDSGPGFAVIVSFTGSRFVEPLAVQVTPRSNAPDEILLTLLDQVITTLGLTPSSSDLREAARSAEQAPSLPSLGPVGLAMARLPVVELEDLEAAAQLDPDSSWVLTEYARALSLSGQQGPAIEASIRATELLPTDVEAWVVRGAVHLTTGDTRQAAFAFTEALRLNPAHALALAGIARASLDTPGPAADTYEAAIESSPRLLNAYLGLANLQEDDQRTLQVLRRAVDNLPDSIQLHRSFLERTVHLGDIDGAFSYLQQTVENPIAASPATFALVNTLPLTNSEAIIDFLEGGLDLFPGNPTLIAAIAEVRLRTGESELAEDLLRAALAQLPADPGLTNALAIALAQQGRVEEAFLAFRSVAEADEEFQVNLAQTFLEAGQPRAAIDTLAEITDLQEDAVALTLYGIALGRIGRFAEADSALGRALELNPDSPLASQARVLLTQQREITGGVTIELPQEAASNFDRGLFALEQRLWVDAADAFARAMEFQPTPLIAFYEAYALQLTGRHRDALSGYKLAAEAYPNSDIVLNNLGYTHLQLGRFDLALEALEYATELNPGNASALLNLGLAYFSLYRYCKALELWDTATSLDPSLESSLTELRAAARERANPCRGSSTAVD